MSESQPTTPAVDAAGNPPAATQGTAQLPEPNHTALLQVDPNDEAIDLSDIDSTTSTSITSSIRNYQYENGRRYHALREGEYLLPNDEREQDRLDLHHHIFRLTLGGPLIRAPIPPNPQRVVDLGTGTGMGHRLRRRVSQRSSDWERSQSHTAHVGAGKLQICCRRHRERVDISAGGRV